MAILQQNWKDLIKPTALNVEYPDNDKTKATIVIEPLERGYGITFGNALRRILLSSIKGFAVTSIKIDGVLHEFSLIDGVKEDVLDIIMNIKSLIISKNTASSGVLKLKINSYKGPVLASDIILSNNIEILNPELVICNIEDEKVDLNIEMTVEYGVGYSLSSEKDKTGKDIRTIYLDALFNPVKKVAYTVENARIGQKTDYDKLILNVETNGTISPKDAVSISAKILQDQLQAFVSFDVGAIENVKVNTEEEVINNKITGSNGAEFNSNLLKRVDELGLSVRSYNCITTEGIWFVSDLVQKTESEMLNLTNFGRKSLNEIKDILITMGLNFGMILDDLPDEFRTEIANKKNKKKK